jgi:hypothetical protein
MYTEVNRITLSHILYLLKIPIFGVNWSKCMVSKWIFGRTLATILPSRLFATLSIGTHSATNNEEW